jgi:hypothetical protein
MTSRKPPPRAKSLAQTPVKQDAPLPPVPTGRRREEMLGVVGLLASIAPLPIVGEVVSAVLTGSLTNGRFDRVDDEMRSLYEDIRKVEGETKAAAAKMKMSKEEFEEIWAETLERMAKEPNPAHRIRFRRLLLNILRDPDTSFDEQRLFLRLLNEFTPLHLQVLQAFAAPPDQNAGFGPPSMTIRQRIGGAANEGVLKSHADDLERAGLLQHLERWNTTLSNPTELRDSLTPRAHRFLRFQRSP